MTPCEKPVAEQTLGEISHCGWDTLKNAMVDVFSHPGGATVTEWIIAVLAILTLLFFIISLIPRRA